MKPVRIGIAGLNHDHVFWILNRPNRNDIEIVGISEPNPDLIQRYSSKYGFRTDIAFGDLEEMLDRTKPEAVMAFGSIYDHLSVVEACAPRGIHVMVEKPLAVSVDHATRMNNLAQQYGIHLLTNYETTWYATTEKIFQMVCDEHLVGDIWKTVIHDGHKGPKEVGCTEEFLDWLTDPVLNGGGALIDFGCYGANLMTWLMQGERPTAVMAVTQQIKPDIYNKVDDEATIILTYPKAQAIVQGSWNWPFSRKDIEVYGQTGYVIAVDGHTMRVRQQDQKAEQLLSLEPRATPFDDPFAYLAAVVQNEVRVTDTDLSSLKLNMTVVEILSAARESAKTGQIIYLS